MAKIKGGHASSGMMISLVSMAGDLAAATVARKTLKATWKAVTGVDPPDDPKSRDVDWTVAILWAVASGAAIGVARLVVERQVASRMAGDKD